MKKFYLLFVLPLLLLLCFSTLRGQNWVWGVQGKGAKKVIDEGYGVALDKNLNVFQTGYFSDTLLFGSFQLYSPAMDIYLAKYNSNGSVIWATQSASGPFGYTIATGVAVDKNGNAIITGYFQDSIKFGNIRLNCGKAPFCCYIVKYAPNGNVIWATQSIGGPYCQQYIYSIATDKANNIYVTGHYMDSIRFGNKMLVSPNNNYNFFLAKLDSTGSIKWLQQPSNFLNSYCYGNSITVDDSAHIYITGQFEGSLTFGVNTFTSSSYYETYLVKYDSGGTVIWAKQSVNHAKPSDGYGVAVDRTGSSYITGYFQDSISFGVNKLYSPFISPFIVKYNSAGSIAWAINGNVLDKTGWQGYSLACDTLAHLYFTGGGGGPNACKIAFGNDTLSGTGVYLDNASVIEEFDSSGHALCGSFTPVGGDDLNGVATNATGSYIIFESDAAASAVFGNDTVGGSHSEWPFLAKWQPCTQINGISISQPDSICPGGHVQLSASGGKTYSWAPSLGLSCTNCPNPIATPPFTITYTLVATNQAGNKVRDSVTVKIVPLPALTTNPKKDSVCAGGSIAIFSSGASTYRWIPNTALSCDTCNNPTATPTITTTYTVIGANSLGCTDSATATVVITPLPQVTLTPPRYVCPGDSVTLTATGGGLYQWSTGSTDSSITVHPDSLQKYSVTVIKGCSTTASTSVTVVAPILFACCDTTIEYGGTVNLYAQLSAHYKWTPSTGLSCDTCPNVIASPSVTTTYTIIGTDTLGCQVERVLTVVVQDMCNDYHVPNVFTPNGDRVNDMFDVNVTDIASYSISIYDRWGQEIFSSSNPSQPWDGKATGGADAPEGVYYYSIKATCKDGRSSGKQGFVQLIR